MRKLIFILSALVFITVTACSGNDGSNTTDDVETNGMDDRDSADMDMHGE